MLAGLAGILSLRYPAQGALLLALIWLLDLPRSRPWPRLLCLLLVFSLCLAYAAVRENRAPPVPDWLGRASLPFADQGEAGGESLPPAPLRVSALVEGVEPLSGGRLRMLLTDLVPEHAVQNGSGPAAYRGKAAWTWYRPEFTPLPGQRLTADMRLAPQRGFANPGSYDPERYWLDRGVFFRAWSGTRAGALALAPEKGGLYERARYRLALVRAGLQSAFYAALPRQGAGNGTYEAAAAAPGKEAGKKPGKEPGKAARAKGGQTSLARGAAVLPALIFADRSGLDASERDLFARATLAHSLALSGLHLGFALLAGWCLALLLGRLVPGIWLRLARPKLALLLALPFAALQLVLGQFPLSLMRAAAMLVVWTIFLLLDRPRVLLDGLFAALALLLLLNPLWLFDLSLQLSALCVAVMALALPRIQNLARRFALFAAPRAPEQGRLNRALRGGFTLLSISFCIQLALLPLTARAFGASGLMFPLNLLWLPVLGTLVMPLAYLGLFCAGLGLETAAGLCLTAANWPCAALVRLLHGLDAAGLLPAPLLPRPHWLSMAGFWLLLLCLPALAALWRNGPGQSFAHKVRLAAVSLLAATMLGLPPLAAVLDKARPGVRLALLDVGQGQAALVEWSGIGPDRAHGRLLLDGGGFATGDFDIGKAVIAPVLTDNALPRLEAVINSHPDTDHLAGLLFILERFAVGRYLTNGQEPLPRLAARQSAALKKSGLAAENLRAGQAIELAPGLHLECLWPTAEEAQERAGPLKTEAGNNASLVVRLVWQGRPLALFCGDAEIPALQGLLRQGRATVAQVLVLPHHGSAGSMLPAFYRAVNPALALASCGYGNAWGFPSRVVREELAKKGVPLLTTADCGQIGLFWNTPEEAPVMTQARALPDGRHP